MKDINKMMDFNIMDTTSPVTETITRRFSCRTYIDKPIPEEKRNMVEEFISANKIGPFKTTPRFHLIAASAEDHKSLKGLGTYGFIKGASGFIIGCTERNSEYNLEDYGYIMERIILFATSIELGTCWLGGSFNKSTFSQKIAAKQDELVPAVAAIGHIASKRRLFDKVIRWSAKATKRKHWSRLYFQETFNTALSPETAGSFSVPLDMVRLAPSASNRQPWRIIKEKDNNIFHFYLQRTKGYYERNKKMFKMTDLQRVDMGIAMYHFDLTCKELGIKGKWIIEDPEIENLPELTSYLVTWVEITE
jgi:nitroreductase